MYVVDKLLELGGRVELEFGLQEVETRSSPFLLDSLHIQSITKWI